MISSITDFVDRGDETSRAPWQVRAVAIATAVITNVCILTAGRIVKGEFPVATVGDDDQSIAYLQVIGVTMLIGLIAWGLLFLLERTTSRSASVWLAIAIVFFLISLIGPLVQGENASSKVVLALMHLGAFLTIVPLLRQSAVTPRA